jgi:hypothetical protein
LLVEKNCRQTRKKGTMRGRGTSFIMKHPAANVVRLDVVQAR